MAQLSGIPEARPVVRSHALPPTDDGAREHELTPDCWCEPELTYRDPDTGGETWTHRRVQ